MSYLALYRKYRPSSFSDLVGQSEVSSIIKNEILNGKISHAYLFSGPRGTGKTSTAKIIAKMINCHNLSVEGIPCGNCSSCLNFDSSSDIVEIDAASNNGVDEIRDLRDKVNLVPSYGRYKIYIIDEVHMLTTQAFNALLKTLEEPPAHIVFILATTEFYKIPITVVSRCQKFQFLKFSTQDIIARLRYISDEEGILVDDDVLIEIARLSDGGMRDAINMLDQLSSFKDGQLTVQDVYKLNGVVSYKEFYDLLNFVYKNDINSIVSFVDNLDQSGKNLDRFLGDFIDFVKDILIFKNTNQFDSNISEKNSYLSKISDFFDNDDLYLLIVSLNDLSSRLKNSSFAKILLIIEFIKLSRRYSHKGIVNDVIENAKNDKNKIVVNDINPNNSNDYLTKNNNKVTQKKKIKITDRDKMIRINNAFATASKDSKEKFLNQWNLVRDKLSNDVDFVSITGMMNDVEVMVVGINYVIFVAQYDSLLDRLYEHIDIIEKLLLEVFEVAYKVVFLARDEWDYEKNKYVTAFKYGKK